MAALQSNPLNSPPTLYWSRRETDRHAKRFSPGLLFLVGHLALAAIAIVSGTLMVRLLPEHTLHEQVILTRDIVKSVVLPGKPVHGIGGGTAKPGTETPPNS